VEAREQKRTGGVPHLQHSVGKSPARGWSYHVITSENLLQGTQYYSFRSLESSGFWKVPAMHLPPEI